MRRLFPLVGSGRVVGKEEVANGDTTQVQANNFRMMRIKGVDDFEASAAEVDVESGVGVAG